MLSITVLASDCSTVRFDSQVIAIVYCTCACSVVQLKVTFGQSAAEHGGFPLTWKVRVISVGSWRKFQRKLLRLTFCITSSRFAESQG